MPVIIYSLRPVSMLSDFAQRKTNPKSETIAILCITSEAMQYRQAPLSYFDENLFR